MSDVFRQAGDARGRRYDPATRELARRMYDDGDGWPVRKIVAVLNQRGVPVRAETVRCWVDEAYRARRAKVTSEIRRRRVDRKGAYVRRRMVELHRAGLSYESVSVVVAIYHGREISAEMVRHFIHAERQHQRAAA